MSHFMQGCVSASYSAGRRQVDSAKVCVCVCVWGGGGEWSTTEEYMACNYTPIVTTSSGRVARCSALHSVKEVVCVAHKTVYKSIPAPEHAIGTKQGSFILTWY
jgi:hypothetical protein